MNDSENNSPIAVNDGERINDSMPKEQKHSLASAKALGALEWIRSRFDRSAAGGLVFAGFWYRMAAFLIDFPLSLTLALAALTGLQLLVPSGYLGPINTVGGNTAALLLIQAAYFVCFERSGWKATPGKRFFKLRVTDKRGMRIGWLRAVLRFSSKLSIPFTAGAVLLWVFFSSKSETLYDKLTGTLVLRKTNESFLPGFLPPIIRQQHWLIVVMLSMAMSVFALRAAVQVMVPRVDMITLNLLVNEGLKDLAPVQRSIEGEMASAGKPPAKVDPALFSRSPGRRHMYLPESGSITVMFNQGKLNGRGLALTPTMNPQTKEVAWSCAGVNLPEALSPKNCSATR